MGAPVADVVLRAGAVQAADIRLATQQRRDVMDADVMEADVMEVDAMETTFMGATSRRAPNECVAARYAAAGCAATSGAGDARAPVLRAHSTREHVTRRGTRGGHQATPDDATVTGVVDVATNGDAASCGMRAASARQASAHLSGTGSGARCHIGSGLVCAQPVDDQSSRLTGCHGSIASSGGRVIRALFTLGATVAVVGGLIALLLGLSRHHVGSSYPLSGIDGAATVDTIVRGITEGGYVPGAFVTDLVIRCALCLAWIAVVLWVLDAVRVAISMARAGVQPQSRIGWSRPITRLVVGALAVILPASSLQAVTVNAAAVTGGHLESGSPAVLHTTSRNHIVHSDTSPAGVAAVEFAPLVDRSSGVTDENLTGSHVTRSGDAVAESEPTAIRHTVVVGDTLSGIAAQHLDDATRWPDIFELNTEREMTDGRDFDDPHLIIPGWSLVLPGGSVPDHLDAAEPHQPSGHEELLRHGAPISVDARTAAGSLSTADRPQRDAGEHGIPMSHDELIIDARGANGDRVESRAGAIDDAWVTGWFDTSSSAQSDATISPDNSVATDALVIDARTSERPANVNGGLDDGAVLTVIDEPVDGSRTADDPSRPTPGEPSGDQSITDRADDGQVRDRQPDGATAVVEPSRTADPMWPTWDDVSSDAGNGVEQFMTGTDEASSAEMNNDVTNEIDGDDDHADAMALVLAPDREGSEGGAGIPTDSGGEVSRDESRWPGPGWAMPAMLALGAVLALRGHRRRRLRSLRGAATIVRPSDELIADEQALESLALGADTMLRLDMAVRAAHQHVCKLQTGEVGDERGRISTAATSVDTTFNDVTGEWSTAMSSLSLPVAIVGDNGTVEICVVAHSDQVSVSTVAGDGDQRMVLPPAPDGWRTIASTATGTHGGMQVLGSWVADGALAMVDGDFPAPACVQIGDTDDGRQVFIDLGAVGRVMVESAEVAAAIAATVGTSPFASGCPVSIVGDDPLGIARLDGIRHVERSTVATAVDSGRDDVPSIVVGDWSDVDDVIDAPRCVGILIDAGATSAADRPLAPHDADLGTGPAGQRCGARDLVRIVSNTHDQIRGGRDEQDRDNTVHDQHVREQHGRDQLDRGHIDRGQKDLDTQRWDTQDRDHYVPDHRLASDGDDGLVSSEGVGTGPAAGEGDAPASATLHPFGLVFQPVTLSRTDVDRLVALLEQALPSVPTTEMACEISATRVADGVPTPADAAVTGADLDADPGIDAGVDLDVNADADAAMSLWDDLMEPSDREQSSAPTAMATDRSGSAVSEVAVSGLTMSVPGTSEVAVTELATSGLTTSGSAVSEVAVSGLTMSVPGTSEVAVSELATPAKAPQVASSLSLPISDTGDEPGSTGAGVGEPFPGQFAEGQLAHVGDGAGVKSGVGVHGVDEHGAGADGGDGGHFACEQAGDTSVAGIGEHLAADVAEARVAHVAHVGDGCDVVSVVDARGAGRVVGGMGQDASSRDGCEYPAGNHGADERAENGGVAGFMAIADVIADARGPGDNVDSDIDSDVDHDSDVDYGSDGEAASVVIVELLGEPRVRLADGTPVVFERAKSVELLAWLVTHRERSTRARARSALWDIRVQASTFSNVVSDARRSLGRAVPIDDDWIPRTHTEELSVIPGVVSDVELIANARRRVAAHIADPHGVIAELGPLLAGVRGMPFAGTAYLWPDAEGITSELVIEATSAAAELASAYLDVGDLNGVLRATALGLRVLPGHEELIGLRLRARAGLGDTAGLRQEWASYERILADEWSGGEPAPELVELRSQLLRR